MDYNKLLRDPEEFIKKILWIKTKKRELIRLIPNSAQQRVLDAVTKLRAERRPVRIIILKARQQGISTIVEALLYHDTITNPNTNSLIIADKREKADYLFNISKLFYDKSPEQLRPMFRCRSKQEITFENPSTRDSVAEPGLRSMIKIDTAQDIEAGRAMTLQNVHLSETGFWGGRTDELVGSILQSVPFIPESMVFLESTGNMASGYFYEEWQRAVKGESAFVPIFLAWHDFKEYRLPLTKGELGYFPLSDDEQDLKERFELDNAQIKWRREKNREFRSPDLFAREYPSDEEEAFLSGGAPVYDIKALKWYKRNREMCRPPLSTGEMVNEFDDKGGRKVDFQAKLDGRLKIWEYPKENEEYIMGADTSEGIEGRDASCAQVLKRKTLEQVAEWVGRPDPDIFATELKNLGIYYNDAVIGVEVNNHGLTTLNNLKQSYWNIYSRQVFDEVINKWIAKIGWKTTSTTRPLMIDDLGKLIRERSVRLHSSDLIDECLTYVYNVSGRPDASYSSHDDRVAAMQVALQVYQSEPLNKSKIKLDKEEEEVTGSLTTRQRRLLDWYSM